MPPVHPPRRERLTRQSVLTAAIALADEGVGVPSTRQLADRLGVKAMALYHHFRNKDALVDGMVDRVFEEIELPAEGVDWETALRRRAVSMRAALKRHPWAIGLLDSRRSPGLATLRRHDAALGRLRAGGFSIADAAHAFSVLDSYVYGFALQELSLPFDSTAELEDVGEEIVQRLPEGEFAHLAEMIRERALGADFDYAGEFERGLDLIVSGLRAELEHRR